MKEGSEKIVLRHLQVHWRPVVHGDIEKLIYYTGIDVSLQLGILNSSQNFNTTLGCSCRALKKLYKKLAEKNPSNYDEMKSYHLQ